MARIFGVDQTQENTSRIVGTFFGVLILEIISGKKISGFYQSSYAEDLLNYVITRRIHIGVLCVQENINARLSIAAVVLMLSSCSFALSVPQEPAFFSCSIMGSNTLEHPDSNQCTSKSIIIHNNLEKLLDSLSSNASISMFYIAKIGNDQDRLFGLSLCYDFVATHHCENCIVSAIQDIKNRGENKNEAVVWKEFSSCATPMNSSLAPWMYEFYAFYEDASKNSTEI
ncbi:hypothetical protein ACSBR2_016036 [Camellia fascicularis]